MYQGQSHWQSGAGASWSSQSEFCVGEYSRMCDRESDLVMGPCVVGTLLRCHVSSYRTTFLCVCAYFRRRLMPLWRISTFTTDNSRSCCTIQPLSRYAASRREVGCIDLSSVSDVRPSTSSKRQLAFEVSTNTYAIYHFDTLKGRRAYMDRIDQPGVYRGIALF
jgi:hypothetical protein